MSFSSRIRKRLIRRVALGLAVAAVVAPSAGAMGHGSLYHQESAGLSIAEAYPPGHVVEAPRTFEAYPPGAVIEAPETFAYPPGAVAPETFAYPPGHVVEAPSTIDWRGIEVGPNGFLTAPPSPEADAPVSYPIGAPGGVVQPTDAVPVADDGFDWRIGVVAGLGALAAIVFGAVMLFSRRRSTLQGA